VAAARNVGCPDQISSVGMWSIMVALPRGRQAFGSRPLYVNLCRSRASDGSAFAARAELLLGRAADRFGSRFPLGNLAVPLGIGVVAPGDRVSRSPSMASERVSFAPRIW